MFVLVFNPTEYNQVIDEEGHSVEPHTWGCADRDYVAPLLESHRLFEVDGSKVNERKAHSVIMAKQEVDRRNGELKKDDEAIPEEASDAAEQGAKKSTKKK